MLPKDAPLAVSRVAVMQNVESMQVYMRNGVRIGRVLDGVSLCVLRAQRYGILGAQAFELKTLIEVLANLQPYASGSCSLMQIGMFRHKRRILSQVYYINGLTRAHAHMRVLDWLMFAGAKMGQKAAARQIAWLDLLRALEITHITLTPISALTDAERGVVELLLSLYAQAQLIMVDFSHIRVPDVLFKAISGIFTRLSDAGRTVILASTQPELLEESCTHAAFLIGGKIAAADTVAALCEAYDPRVAVIRADAAEKVAERLEDRFKVEIRNGEAHVLRGCMPADMIFAELAGAGVESVTVCKPCLREAFARVFCTQCGFRPEDGTQRGWCGDARC